MQKKVDYLDEQYRKMMITELESVISIAKAKGDHEWVDKKEKELKELQKESSLYSKKKKN